MNNDEIDKMLYDYYKNLDEKIPIKIRNTIQNFPKEKLHRSKKRKILWKISTVCAMFLMICTITFGKEIYLYILDRMAKVHEGIATALNNEYYSEINMEYAESNNVGIKIDYVLMDDYNLFLAFDTKYEINNVIYKARFEDLIITDENNNLIFCDDIDTYEKYCKDSGKEVRTIPKDSITNGGYGIENIETRENNVVTLYKLYSSQFPKSKELNMEMHTVELTTREETMNIEGVWKIKINLPEDFYEREDIIYFVKDGSDKKANISIESAVVTNTQTVVKYKGNSKKYDGTQEGLEDKINNLLNGGGFYDEIWLENEKGKKFETSATNDGYGTKYSPDGTYEGKLPFSLTTYDLTDTIYLVIEKDGIEYRINLVR